MLLVSHQTTQDDDVIVFLDAFDVFPNGLDGHVRKPGFGFRFVSLRKSFPNGKVKILGESPEISLKIVAEMKWIHPGSKEDSKKVPRIIMEINNQIFQLD